MQSLRRTCAPVQHFSHLRLSLFRFSPLRFSRLRLPHLLVHPVHPVHPVHLFKKYLPVLPLALLIVINQGAVRADDATLATGAAASAEDAAVVSAPASAPDKPQSVSDPKILKISEGSSEALSKTPRLPHNQASATETWSTELPPPSRARARSPTPPNTVMGLINNAERGDFALLIGSITSREALELGFKDARGDELTLRCESEAVCQKVAVPGRYVIWVQAMRAHDKKVNLISISPPMRNPEDAAESAPAAFQNTQAPDGSATIPASDPKAEPQSP